MDIVMIKSFIGKTLDWITEKLDNCFSPCLSAMVNGWNFCKRKTKEAFNCCSSDNETDRCVLKSFTLSTKYNLQCMQLLFIRRWLRLFGFSSVKMFDTVLNISVRPKPKETETFGRNRNSAASNLSAESFVLLSIDTFICIFSIP